MPQSLAKVAIHIVFSTKDRRTKDRRAWLKDPAISSELYAYMAGILKSLDCSAIKIGGHVDHVHVLCLLSRTQTIARLVEDLKVEPAKWLKKKGPAWEGFCWQAGYAVFSVSESKIEAVVAYIANQHEHHRRMTFQEEFRAICAKHGVDVDERYAWG